ncbi:hypothetical protein BDV93DRAFT_302775 [Ceratobasidium sp. AG-I]|nr:hypothetical protein BDV93DRAFT_302775 [Ceratobasidium sp. AG-I]
MRGGRYTIFLSEPLAAINALPEEILAHVFHLAADTERCVHYNDRTDEICPSALLDSLPQVCSYWHRLAISLSSLWSHIDLADQGDFCGHLYNRARLWIERARDGPLDIHIYGRARYRRGKFQALADFLAPLMKQTRSLKTEMHASPGLIHSMFSGLCGASPPLHSHAYHGLIELQLLTMNNQTSVTQTQLMAVLSSSPGLRTLTVGINITIDPITKDAQFSPVRLENLEELCVIELPTFRLGLLLGMLAPESNSLKVSIKRNSHNFADEFYEGTDAFFRRSKVVALRIKGFSVKSWFPLALDSLPHLHTLFLHDQIHTRHYPSEDDTSTITTSSMCLQLRNLYISNCTLSTQALKNVVASHPIHTLGIRDCKFVDPNWRYDTELDDVKSFINEAHPHIKQLDSGGFERALKIWEFEN